MMKPLSFLDRPVRLEFLSDASGPPTLEALSDGRTAFRIRSAGPVTGEIEGTITASVAEVNPNAAPVFQPVSIVFTIETERGTLEGYYAGMIHTPRDAAAGRIDGHGRLLSVSGVYADLFLAEVLVSSRVEFVNGHGSGERGTMTIMPRTSV